MMSRIFFLATLLLASCADVPDNNHITDQHRQSAAASSDIEALLDALDTIERRHRELGASLLLNTGASSEELDAVEEVLGCAIPTELRQLWQWRNGERTEHFLWYHRFLSTEDALAEYSALKSSEWGLPWRKNWIPIFESQEEWYGVECSESSTVASPVIFFFIETGASVSYTNVTSYMKTMAEAMVRNAVTWDGNAWTDDINLLSQIHAVHNTGIEFPYYVRSDD